MSVSGSEEDEMAAFMGFSTFGKAPAPKKRKFNPSTDAFIDGEELDARKIDRGGKKGKGSGGNEVPLGKVRSVGGGGGGMNLPAPVVREEIAMAGGFGERSYGLGNGNGIGKTMNLPPARKVLRASPPREQEDGAMYMDTSLPPPTDGPQYMDTSLPPPVDGPQYMDTILPPPHERPAYTDISRPPPAYVDMSLPTPISDLPIPAEIDPAEAAEMQERIDKIMASIQPPPGSEPSDYPPSLPPLPNPATSNFPPHQNQRQINALPTRPPASFQNGRGTSDAGSSISGGRQRGEKNAEWYIGYYDPAFNENPWEKLEKEKGLVEFGSWVERAKREVR